MKYFETPPSIEPNTAPNAVGSPVNKVSSTADRGDAPAIINGIPTLRPSGMS